MFYNGHHIIEMKYIMSGSEFYESQEEYKRYIVNSEKQKKAAEIALAQHIDRKRRQEFKHSFEIPHEKRQEMFYSWQWCRKKGFPINTFLQFEIDYDPNDCTDNVKHVRSISHNVLMFLRRNGKIPSHVLWSRMVPVGSNKELCSLICHIPDNLYQKFKGYACKWNGLNISVQQCTYEKEWSIDDTDKLVTVFDILCQATSRETQYKIPGVHSVSSEIVFRPRVFHSEKLSKEDMMREMKARSVMKELERIGNAVKDQKQQQQQQSII